MTHKDEREKLSAVSLDDRTQRSGLIKASEPLALSGAHEHGVDVLTQLGLADEATDIIGVRHEVVVTGDGKRKYFLQRCLCDGIRGREQQQADGQERGQRFSHSVFS
jgi:hypothetical protein